MTTWPAWQPIESAPRDRTVVLFDVPSSKLPVMAPGDDYWYGRKPDGTGFAYWLDHARGWMPLPPRGEG